MSLTAWAADKTAAWSPLYYGELPYLLAAVASGARFQLFSIERDSPSEPRAVNPRLRLTLPAARAVATVAVISLYRLLRASQRSCQITYSLWIWCRSAHTTRATHAPMWVSCFALCFTEGVKSWERRR